MPSQTELPVRTAKTCCWRKGMAGHLEGRKPFRLPHPRRVLRFVHGHRGGVPLDQSPLQSQVRPSSNAWQPRPFQGRQTPWVRNEAPSAKICHQTNPRGCTSSVSRGGLLAGVLTNILGAACTPGRADSTLHRGSAVAAMRRPKAGSRQPGGLPQPCTLCPLHSSLSSWDCSPQGPVFSCFLAC